MFLDTDNLKDSEIYLQLETTIDGNSDLNLAPAYYFKICRISDGVMVGHCEFRVGHSERLYFGGNIGYTVYEPYRGNHYAAKACKLILHLAKKHKMKYLYITCNPDNFASRKTCEFAGGILEAIVDLPPDNDMYIDGERKKCIYHFDLT